jgi:hypothetical protein
MSTFGVLKALPMQAMFDRLPMAITSPFWTMTTRPA